MVLRYCRMRSHRCLHNDMQRCALLFALTTKSERCDAKWHAKICSDLNHIYAKTRDLMSWYMDMEYTDRDGMMIQATALAFNVVHLHALTWMDMRWNASTNIKMHGTSCYFIHNLFITTDTPGCSVLHCEAVLWRDMQWYQSGFLDIHWIQSICAGQR